MTQTISPLDTLELLSSRFGTGGIDLQSRPVTKHWPYRYRARVVTASNEKAPFRTEVWGRTAAEAIVELAAAVALVDSVPPRRYPGMP